MLSLNNSSPCTFHTQEVRTKNPGIGAGETAKIACGADSKSLAETAAVFETLWAMFLRHKVRRKDGKEHRYWSIVENRRASGGSDFGAAAW